MREVYKEEKMHSRPQTVKKKMSVILAVKSAFLHKVLVDDKGKEISCHFR